MSIERLVATVGAEPDLESSVERLVGDLAERIKATSNDQNIQKLARDLALARSDLVRAVAGKVPVGQAPTC